jgi:hypothetical protein
VDDADRLIRGWRDQQRAIDRLIADCQQQIKAADRSIDLNRRVPGNDKEIQRLKDGQRLLWREIDRHRSQRRALDRLVSESRSQQRSR